MMTMRLLKITNRVKRDPNPDIKDTVEAKFIVDNLVKDDANYDTNSIINNNVSNGEVLKNENLIQLFTNDRCIDDSINKFVKAKQDHDFQKDVLATLIICHLKS